MATESKTKVIAIKDLSNQEHCENPNQDFTKNLDRYDAISTNRAAEGKLYDSAKIMRAFHVAIATLIAFIPPIAVYFLMISPTSIEIYNLLGLTYSNTVLGWIATFKTGIAITLLLGCAIVSSAKCNPLIALSGLAISPIIFYMGNVVTLALAVSIACLIGSLLLASLAFYFLRESHIKTLKHRKNKEDLNPRCTNCYISKICPMQPDGFLDQYTPASDR